ncbi:succinate dehydrogenase, putative [Perkinsus marinus ATCC 50983]|uniref:Succinate dehydrogenase, putative n=1 Tax=Perkinsus marinus (strain ATCC 50983 / TXsc) TaxID=423536 RepID=C5KHL3_PERM5|nr:succinate dehydrogenase, putative [Perkinsus marinus ATCC 50983]EER16075.1 succinate dehydrogenase, putative [Perkinsus marinus ATCC 50983]|eukprot:XP_002784279.1 succinate dehydrogenase, putative [Perkinsus marinus ATCC 50983]
MQSYTIQQVAKHNRPDDCWIVIDGKVIDCSKYLLEHPGGSLSITAFAGTDCSLEYNTVHKKELMEQFQDLVIGLLVESIPMAEVEKHREPNDCWVVINGMVVDVTQYQHDHPGGVIALTAFGGTDCSLEYNTCHAKALLEEEAGQYILGPVTVQNKRRKTRRASALGGSGGGGLTMSEVAKHTSKGDCWVVVNGFVLNVTEFLSQHPGGEAAIMQYAGKDASEEWNMIHQPEVLQKYGGKYIIGKLGAAVPSVKAATLTLDVVAGHNGKDDCWIVVNNMVYNVTEFLAVHPGGEAAIMAYAGKDASEQWNMIHPADTMERYGKKYEVGELGSSLGGSGGAGGGPVGVLDEDEVAKHIAEDDCWVIINGKVYNVTEWLPLHPGGVAAIMAYAGRDASEQFNMIHPEGTLEKHGKKYLVGDLGSVPAGATIANDLTEPLLKNSVPNDHWWGDARNTYKQYGPLGPSITNSVVKYSCALAFFIVMLAYEIGATVFTVKNYKVVHDKSGLTRAALFMIFFVIIHGLGNLHVFAGADHFNSYGYFLNHPVLWGSLMLPVELYLLFAGLMHVVVACVRTYKFKKISMGVDQLWMAISGLFVLVFIVIHLTQFRLISEEAAPKYYFRSKWMYPFFCEKDDTSCEIVHFKDLYRMEMELFSNIGWCGFYLVGVLFFISHAREGLRKIITVHALVPRNRKATVSALAETIIIFIGLCYLSFPIYCYLCPIRDWDAYEAQQPISNGDS